MGKLTPEQYGEKAYGLFLNGYNCSQAVVCAFIDLLQFDEQTAILMSSAFGGGMGRLREVCGCLSGCYMVLGLLTGGKVPSDHAAKSELYRKVQAFAGIFKERNGSIICRELLALDIKGADQSVPEKRTQEYYQKRPCPKLAKDTAEQFALFLEEEGVI